MSLFDQILGAVNNPDQQGSVDQLGSLVGLVQQVSGNHGLDESATQSLMSMVGSAVQSGLQTHNETHGLDSTQNLVQQLSHSASANPGAIAALIPPEVQHQIASAIAQRTGLDAGMVQAMIPALIPAVMQMLQSGTTQSGGVAGSNPLLNMFLDSNHDGNLDVGDAMGLAMQFMQNR